MSDPLRTSEDYELFIYTLKELFPSIRHSTVTFFRSGASLARVSGELHFDCSIRLIVRERLTFDCLPGSIDGYGYEVWQDKVKLYWYDPQPHLDEPSLQSNHPHHKHITPNIKHNRTPEPKMSFNQPNLPTLIQEIEALIKEKTSIPNQKKD